MDQSAQSIQNQQPGNRLQAPTARPALGDANSQVSTPSSPMPVGSINKEAGPVTAAQESATNEEVQKVSHEAKKQVSPEQGISNLEEIEAQPSIPEPTIDTSVEHVVEQTPNTEKPVLSESVKKAGITHSGPGVIPDTPIKIEKNGLEITPPPISYQQVVLEEKKTAFKSSKHWLLALYEIVWRKINPKIGNN